MTRPTPAAACDHVTDPLTTRTITLTGSGFPFTAGGYRLDDRPGPRLSAVTAITLTPTGCIVVTVRAMAEDVDVLGYQCRQHWRVFIADIDVLSPAVPATGGVFIPAVRWIGRDLGPTDGKDSAVLAEVDLYVAELHTESTPG